MCAASIATQGSNAQLTARLWDVLPGGQKRLVTRAPYRLRDGQTGRIVFQLHGNGYKFATGHTVKLELTGSDAPTFRPSNGVFTVRVSDLVAELPVAAGRRRRGG